MLPIEDFYLQNKYTCNIGGHRCLALVDSFNANYLVCVLIITSSKWFSIIFGMIIKQNNDYK